MYKKITFREKILALQEANRVDMERAERALSRVRKREAEMKQLSAEHIMKRVDETGLSLDQFDSFLSQVNSEPLSYPADDMKEKEETDEDL